jgi:phosphoribosylformylglycinamidine (FGAM) synthase-like enzyme
VTSAHDVAEGGLAVALAESAIAGGLGVEVELAGRPAADPRSVDLRAADPPPADLLTALFGEGPGRFVLSGDEASLRAIPGATIIGKVGGDAVRLRTGHIVLDAPVAELRSANDTGLARVLQ